MPKLDSEQRKIVRLIRREGRNIRDPRVRRVYERAAVQTGIVESGLRNLDHGDADSQGWRQERASLYKNPTNLKASVRRFRQEFQQHYDPGEKSYDVAGQVQRPAAQYIDRYRQEAPEARQILRQVGGAAPGGGAAPSSRRVPTYGMTPGVDNSALRQDLKLSYLQDRGNPNALLDLALGLQGAEDVPGERVRTGSRVVRRGSKKPNRTTSGRNAESVVDSLQGWAEKNLGIAGGSRDRDRGSNAAVGGSSDSDHLEGGGGGAYKGREAVDLPTTAAQGGWTQYKKTAKRLGLKPAANGFTQGTVKIGGQKYRVQVIFGDEHNHGDHIHVGVRRA